MLKVAIAIVFAAVCQSSLAQQAIPFRELVFQGPSGYRPGETNEYFLFKRSFLRGAREADESALISEWSTAHPAAEAVPVSILGERSRFPIVYAWAVDGEENLNLFLVRQGIYSALSMLDISRPARLMEAAPNARYIQEAERQGRLGNPGNVLSRRLISQSRYEAFVTQLLAAELAAQAEAKGIWSEKFKDLRDRTGLVPLGALSIPLLQISE